MRGLWPLLRGVGRRCHSLLSICQHQRFSVGTRKTRRPPLVKIPSISRRLSHVNEPHPAAAVNTETGCEEGQSPDGRSLLRSHVLLQQ